MRGGRREGEGVRDGRREGEGCEGWEEGQKGEGDVRGGKEKREVKLSSSPGTHEQ